MKLTRTVAYAVQATTQLAQSDANVPVPCSKLAKDGQMPERFLLQILRDLVRHGIVRSVRGSEGGYFLGRQAEDVSLLDVIEAVDGTMKPELSSTSRFSKDSGSPLVQALNGVAAAVRRQLQDIRLSELIPPLSRKRK
jgi:Rrf2 family protein